MDCDDGGWEGVVNAVLFQKSGYGILADSILHFGDKFVNWQISSIAVGMIFSILGLPESSDSRAILGTNPRSITVNNNGRKRERYSASKGQLTKTFF
jgi:hypothetical protein